MPQRRPLDAAWGSATSIGAPTPGQAMPVPPGASDEFFARIRTLPDLLAALGGDLDPTTVDAGPAMAMAKVMGKGGKRIAAGAQSALDPALKIPRFRSPHGTFLKYEGNWWRLQPGDPTAIDMVLEYFGKGEKATERLAQGGRPLKRRTIPVDDFVRSVREAKGVDRTNLGRVPRRKK